MFQFMHMSEFGRSSLSESGYELEGLIDGYVDRVVKAFFLRENALNSLSAADWARFWLQRYLATDGFIALLKVGFSRAIESSYEGLANVLGQNINDELGKDKQSSPRKVGSHKVWLEIFYLEIGIDLGRLDTESPTEAVRIYRKIVTDLIQLSPALTIAGAILFLEKSIPAEFQPLVNERNSRFPLMSDDGRRYLDDHIQHDSSAHYPHLHKVLDDIMVSNPDAYKLILEGVNTIGDARRNLYETMLV